MTRKMIDSVAAIVDEAADNSGVNNHTGYPQMLSEIKEELKELPFLRMSQVKDIMDAIDFYKESLPVAKQEKLYQIYTTLREFI